MISSSSSSAAAAAYGILRVAAAAGLVADGAFCVF